HASRMPRFNHTRLPEGHRGLRTTRVALVPDAMGHRTCTSPTPRDRSLFVETGVQPGAGLVS
ncbi:MAG: hypothetical protein WD229_17080, partial [Pirellulales bacterium]